MSYYFDTKDKLTNLSLRDETNYVLDTIVMAKNNLKEFGEGDIRYDYFGLMYNLISNYSQGMKNFFLRLFYELEKGIKKEDLEKVTEKELANMFASTDEDLRIMKTNLERSLLIESWSMFEFAITTIFESLLTKKEQSTRREKQLKEFGKILKKRFPEVEKSVLSLTSQELVNKLDFHVPTINKVNKIFKLFSSDYPGKEKDIAFLSFYNRLRNGIHYNFIYKGKDREDFEFEGTIYKFKNGEPIIENMEDLFGNVSLARELYMVVLRFFKSITITEIIKNPVPTIAEFKRMTGN